MIMISKLVEKKGAFHVPCGKRRTQTKTLGLTGRRRPDNMITSRVHESLELTFTK